jgi:trk system potassium uptake protein TrkH
MILYLIFTLAISLFPGFDFKTATSASIASLGNIGPGIGKVGATCTYAWMHPGAKLILSLAMLLGRLEIYTVLVVFLPVFWKK